MKARVQGADELVIDASPNRIWDILVSSQELPKWMPVVQSTTGDRETVGSVRECEVVFNGKPGRVVESCVEAVPERRIAWTMDEDSYGFGRMLADYGFAFDLEPRGVASTLVRTASYYEPRNLVVHLMNWFSLRRQFRTVRKRALSGLQRLAETPHSAGARHEDPPGAAAVVG